MDSKERSCDCEACSMDQSEANDGALMCSKSCYPDSEFEKLFLKLRTCSGPEIHFRITIFLAIDTLLSVVKIGSRIPDKVYAKKSQKKSATKLFELQMIEINVRH